MPGESTRPTVGFSALIGVRRLPNGEIDFDEQSFRRMLAVQMGVPPWDLVINVSIATDNATLATEDVNPALVSFSSLVNTSILKISSLYHSFCVAPAPPPPPSPPSPPPTPPPPTPPAQDVFDFASLHSAVTNNPSVDRFFLFGTNEDDAYAVSANDATGTFAAFCNPYRKMITLEGMSAAPPRLVLNMSNASDIAVADGCKVRLHNLTLALVDGVDGKAGKVGGQLSVS